MNQDSLPTSFDKNAETRQVIHNLSELLDMLYPDPPPEVLTLESFLYVYSWRVLNKSAIDKIEQSQRVNSVIGDYRQIGLNEFYLGLIYLYLGEWHAAARLFDKSQRTWSIKSGNEPASQSLANLAHGYAMEFGYHYEEAMSSYSKASHSLERIRYSTPSHQLDNFRVRIEQFLTAATFGLRSKMDAAPETAANQEPIAIIDTGEVEFADRQETTEQEENGTAPETGETVPPPTWTNLSDDPMPIDGHIKQDSLYRWYEVEKRLTDDFIPQIHPGDWLLVYTQPEKSDLSPTAEEPVVIVSESESGSTIILKPHPSDPNEHGRIFLQTVTVEEGFFNRDPETGEFHSQFERVIRDLDILGVVIGLWRPAALVVNED